MTVVLAASLSLLVTLGESVRAQSFRPIKKLSTWYTDRSPVDIEIVGSTSLIPERHRIELDRVLRLRLARAYVLELLAQEQPGFEIVNLSFDLQTGLPTSLIEAASDAGRFQEDMKDVPRLDIPEIARRRILLTLHSDWSAAAQERFQETLRQCAGPPFERGLVRYEWEGRSRCFRPAYPNGMRLIATYEGIQLLIECEDASFTGTGWHCPFSL